MINNWEALIAAIALQYVGWRFWRRWYTAKFTGRNFWDRDLFKEPVRPGIVKLN